MIAAAAIAAAIAAAAAARAAAAAVARPEPAPAVAAATPAPAVAVAPEPAPAVAAAPEPAPAVAAAPEPAPAANNKKATKYIEKAQTLLSKQEEAVSSEEISEKLFEIKKLLKRDPIRNNNDIHKKLSRLKDKLTRKEEEQEKYLREQIANTPGSTSLMAKSFFSRSKGAQKLHKYLCSILFQQKEVTDKDFFTELNSLITNHGNSILYETSVNDCSHLADCLHLSRLPEDKTSKLFGILLKFYDKKDPRFAKLLLTPTTDGFSLLQQCIKNSPVKLEFVLNLYKDQNLTSDPRFAKLLLTPTTDGFSLLQHCLIHCPDKLESVLELYKDNNLISDAQLANLLRTSTNKGFNILHIAGRSKELTRTDAKILATFLNTYLSLSQLQEMAAQKALSRYTPEDWFLDLIHEPSTT